MLKLKLFVALVICILGATGVALASEGQLPFLPSGADQVSVGDDAYDDDSSGDEGDNGDNGSQDNHGSDVSAVARDKDAVGTKTLPNGKVIENHGQAVREAAHDKGNNDDGSSDDASDEPSEAPPAGGDQDSNGEAHSGGNQSQGSHGNSQGNGNANGHR